MLRAANVIARIRSIHFSSVVYKSKFESVIGITVDELEAELSYTSTILATNEYHTDYSDILSCGIVGIVMNFEFWVANRLSRGRHQQECIDHENTKRAK